MGGALAADLEEGRGVTSDEPGEQGLAEVVELGLGGAEEALEKEKRD